jgi:DNA anti-recombination protein RmuC
VANQDISLTTDVALIKKDLKQIERFFGRFDSALDTMNAISKTVAVQDEAAKSISSKIDYIEKRVAEHKEEDVLRFQTLDNRLEEMRESAYNDHARIAKESNQTRKERNEEIMLQLGKMNGSLDARLSKIDDRIKLLEQWKWYIAGIGAVVILVAANIKWTGLF